MASDCMHDIKLTSEIMENRKKFLRGRPLLVILIILLIIVSAGVWAWRHFPSAPEVQSTTQTDSLKTVK